jgi:hypothetical protein
MDKREATMTKLSALAFAATGFAIMLIADSASATPTYYNGAKPTPTHYTGRTPGALNASAISPRGHEYDSLSRCKRFGYCYQY